MDRIQALRAIVRLHDLQSFSAAAADLRVRQSTVSKWIARLEEDLGVALVRRTTRNLSFTEAGERFADDARAIVEAFEQAVENAQTANPELKGTLRISVPVVFGRQFVVPEIRRFAKQHPDLGIDLRFSDRYENLVDKGIDVAIRVGTPSDSSLITHSLGATPRHLVAANSYLNRHDVPKHPNDLGEHNCLIHSELRFGDIWRFRRGQKEHAIRVRGSLAANHSEALLTLAKSGLGIVMLAAWLTEPELKAKRLVRLLPDYQLPGAPIAALTPPGRRTPRRVRTFIDFLKSGFTPRFTA